MKRFSPAILVLSVICIPIAAHAAQLDAVGIIQAVIDEVRPIRFSYTVTQPISGGMFKATVNGATEGALPDKMWVIVDMEQHVGSAWMKAQTEARVKQGKAYFMLRTYDTSEGFRNTTLDQYLGKWYEAPIASTCNCWGLQNALNADAIGSLFTVSPTRFQQGYSYEMTLHDSGVASLMSVLGLQGTASAHDVALKIDTNTAGAFQYASFGIGSVLQGTAQRQFHAVYVQTPTVVAGVLPDTFNAMLLGMKAEQQSQNDTVDVTDSPSSSSTTKVTSTTTRRRVRASSDRQVIIDLHGPQGSDTKLTVKVATTPVTWKSSAEFHADLQSGRGILYRYERPVKPAFSARGAYAPFDVIFFDRNGRFVSAEALSRCTDDHCVRVLPASPIMYALEVEQGFIAKNKVGNLWRLSLDWLSTSNGSTSLQEADRLSSRTRRERQSVYIPSSTRAVSTDDYVHLKILGELTVQRIRSADLLVATGTGADQDAVRRLWDVLRQTTDANSAVRYMYIVLPTGDKDTFRLVIDNFSYATEEELDVNHNGKIDADEVPTEIGTTYVHSLFTQALQKPTLDTTLGSDVAYYVPIKDPYGVPVGVLAVVESVSH